MLSKVKLRLGKQGFSIAESMVAMAIFALIAIGLTTTVLQTQKLAQTSVIRNTAFTVAQGYLEHMKSISMNELLISIRNSMVPVPTKSVSALGSGDIEQDDPLFLNVENYKEILIDIQNNKNGDPVELTMDMWVTPKINNLNTGAGAIPAMEITVDFEYEARHMRGNIRNRGSLQMVKSQVSE